MTQPPLRSAQSLPQRPRDKEETQERLIQSAVGLFATRGYDGTSVAAIAAGAGVSTSAAFWHFGDKKSLFREAFHRMLMPFFELLDAELAQGSAKERVETLLEIYESTVSEHREMIRTLVRWLVESETAASLLLTPLFQLHGRFEHDLSLALVELGHVEPVASQLAHAIVAGLDGTLVLSLLQPAAEGEEARREGLRRLVAKALEGAGGD